MSEPKTWREWVEFLNPLRLASGEEAFRERDACAAFLEGHVAELRARAETDEKIAVAERARGWDEAADWLIENGDLAEDVRAANPHRKKEDR